MTSLDTPRGQARLHAYRPDTDAVGTLVLGHGAGGSVDAPDLVSVREVALTAGWCVVLVEQPYRVEGRRMPPAAAALDEAWAHAVRGVATAAGSGLTSPGLTSPGLTGPGPLVLGGRSSGARVACRTAAGLGADGVLCLAFPWHPPGKPERSRAAEVAAVPLPRLLVQGDRDPFGQPPPEIVESETVTSVLIEGADHGLKRSTVGALRDAVAGWLVGLVR